MNLLPIYRGSGEGHGSIESKTAHSKRVHCFKLFLCATVVVALQFCPRSSYAQKNQPETPLSFSGGKLRYQPDSLGNRIPDFSYCGYKAGAEIIPAVDVKVRVPVLAGDATLRIQTAIDYISKLPVDGNGFRGAVLLEEGEHLVWGSLLLHTSGVVVKGAGKNTILKGTGKDRATLIRVNGMDDRSLRNHLAEVADEYVPVNSMSLKVNNGNIFKKGDLVRINRRSAKEWIDALGTAHFGGGITALGWKPGQRILEWTRTITAVNGNMISFDAPITNAIERKFGGGTVGAITWPGRISNCAIENLQLVSSFDPANPKDEDHRWMAITLDNVTDSWVRQVSFKHFAGSAVAIYSNASRITVEDCVSQQPISEIGGERRNTFITEGQQVLFQRCYAENGIHDFATGFCAPGPTAFVQCESRLPYDFSGGIDSWSPGVLFDVVNIDGHNISFFNRGQDGQGAGWNNANSVLWNCSAARIDCYKPPTAQNWSFGSWSQFSGDGYWAESNNSIDPRSLYYAQLKERLGKGVDDRVQVMKIETSASSSPSVELAAELTRLSVRPAKTLLEFIEEGWQRSAFKVNSAGIKSIDELTGTRHMDTEVAPVVQVTNGKLVRGESLLAGGRINTPWWSGSSRPYALKNSAPAITRYVPGRIGKGLTDDLNGLTDSMRAKNIVGFDQNYGLWYDRRRDDHERIRRMNGDVWAPFYELPFARSGKELAYDGLSKYDLSKYNYWYWNRLRQFADLADLKGLLLIHQNYFQHNIIEAGAHYTDFPWRTANNINNTGFPEPVPYAGDKRVFMSELFYDTTHPVRRQLHKQYIRQCLENFKHNAGVIQMTSEEYTGPLHFVAFWLNTIREWEQQTGRSAIIGLSATKDVQDAILGNEAYASVVDLIDIKYWHYEADGKVYAPQGGQHLAPRQHARLLKPKASSAEQVYRAVLEYRTRYPNKAVIYSADGWDRNGWAVLMAGGSLPNLKLSNKDLCTALSVMQPLNKSSSKQWILSNKDYGYVIYRPAEGELNYDLSMIPGNYNAYWIDTRNGDVLQGEKNIKPAKNQSLKQPGAGQWALWLRKN